MCIIRSFVYVLEGIGGDKSNAKIIMLREILKVNYLYCHKLVSDPVVIKGMCKDYKVTFKTNIYQVPGNECVCILGNCTRLLKNLFMKQLTVQVILVALRALDVQFPYAFRSIWYMVTYLSLTSIMKSWNGGSVLTWKVHGKFNFCNLKSSKYIRGAPFLKEPYKLEFF